MPPPPPPHRRSGLSSTPPPPPARRGASVPAAAIPAVVPEQRKPVYDFDDEADANSYELAPQVVKPVSAEVQRRCPSCRGQMSDAAVLCMNCGFDTRLGIRRTQSAYDNRESGRGNGVSPFMKFVGWAEIGLAGLAVVVALISLSMKPGSEDAKNIALTAAFMALAVILSGKLRMISALREESVFLVIIYLFVPFGALFLIVTRWEIMRRGFVVTLMGVGSMLLVGVLSEAFRNAN